MIDAEQVAGNDRRPYAAAANVVGVIERIRRINLPEAIDAEFLGVAHVPEPSRGRVLDALRFLQLIHPGGEPTEALEAIAAATDDDYRELLAARIRAAYAVDLNRIDPAQDSQATITSQFRRYQPRSQTMRMVMLFLGLCRAAGMPVFDAPRQRSMRGAGQAAARSRPSTTTVRSSPVAVRLNVPEATVSVDQVVAVNIDDLALIEDQKEYEAAWAALGVVTRAAAKARRAKVAEEGKSVESEV